MISIVLYGRPGCHLCDDARVVVQSAQQKYDFELVEKNIDEDDELLRKYMIEIPVVAINGEDFCHYHVDAKELELKLHSIMKENS